MNTKMKTIRPFGVKDQVGYVFGDMAGSFVNLYVDAYFLTFCTYALGIRAEWMAGLFLPEMQSLCRSGKLIFILPEWNWMITPPGLP